MFITPNSQVDLYFGIDIDKEYNNVYYFNGGGDRDSFFASHPNKKYTLFNQSYQRYNRNTIKVEGEYSDLYNINYMRFKNTAFEDKWFYAFVNKIEYVNNITCLIQYDIDVMTTWCDKYNIRECMVDRCHTKTDEIGEHIIPENLSLGEYYNDKIGVDSGIYPLSLTIFLNINPDTLEPIGGQMINGFYSPVAARSYDFNESGATQMNALLTRIAEGAKLDSILGIELRPRFVHNSGGYKEIRIGKPNGSERFGGYLPKNKKLYSFPYNYLNIVTPFGDSAYRYEYFAGESCAFNLISSGTMGASILCCPLEYLNTPINIENSSCIYSLPSVAYNVNTYIQQYAQMKASLDIRIANTLGQTAASIGNALVAVNTASNLFSNGGVSETQRVRQNGVWVTQPNPEYARIEQRLNQMQSNAIGSGLFSGLASVLQQTASTATSLNEAQLCQLNTRQKIGDFSMMHAGGFDFIFYRKHITEHFAKIVDDFFTMFGYKMCKLMTPALNVRERWCYIKTINCEINNLGIPEEEATIIRNVFNRGVTFWKTTAIVGDYSASNNPLG